MFSFFQNEKASGNDENSYDDDDNNYNVDDDDDDESDVVGRKFTLFENLLSQNNSNKSPSKNIKINKK